MRPTTARITSVIAVALALAGTSATAAVGPTVDWLYVDANEGGSSGGHTAVRLGDTTFHYQFQRPGVLRLAAEPAADFETRYRVLENRTIRVRHIPVSADTFALLDDAFRTRRIADDTQWSCLAELGAHVRLLDALAGAGAGVPVPGAGYLFARYPAPPADATEPALVALGARVARERGAGLVAARAAAAGEALATLPVTVVPDPVACAGVATSWADGAAGMLALVALRDARPLAADALVDVAVALEPAERAALEALRQTLEQRLVELTTATQPGAGLALAVGLARLVALERTLRTGRWHVLDVHAADAPTLAIGRASRRRPLLDALAPIAQREFAGARASLVDAPPGELVLAQLESTGNRLVELERARAGAETLRLHDGPRVPARAAMVDAGALGGPTRGLGPARDAARDAERRFARALTSAHAYRLVTRNCVTELFQTIETAVAAAAPAGRAAADESRERLGGSVSVTRSLAFIPFVSAAAVDAQLARGEMVTLPSWRRERVAARAARDGALRTWLAEGNTLTSTLYRPNPDDSLFLFFTDDMVAPRPLLGVANLVFAAGESLVGLATLPLDGGERLRAALRGALFSLPELAFVNIRKGSFPYADLVSRTTAPDS